MFAVHLLARATSNGLSCLPFVLYEPPGPGRQPSSSQSECCHAQYAPLDHTTSRRRRAKHLIHMFPGRWKAYTHPPSHTRNHSLSLPTRQLKAPYSTFGPANQNTWLRVQNEDENARDADFTRFTQFGRYFCPVIVCVGHDRVQPRKGKAKTMLNQNACKHTLTLTHNIT
jgi:hypothetical protein